MLLTSDMHAPMHLKHERHAPVRVEARKLLYVLMQMLYGYTLRLLSGNAIDLLDAQIIAVFQSHIISKSGRLSLTASQYIPWVLHNVCYLTGSSFHATSCAGSVRRSPAAGCAARSTQ